MTRRCASPTRRCWSEWPRLQGWLADDRVVTRGCTTCDEPPRSGNDGGVTLPTSTAGHASRSLSNVAGTVELSAAERAFLDASAGQRQIELNVVKRRRRRLRTLAAALAVVLVVAAVAGVLAIARQRQAAESARIATAQRLTRAAESADGLDLRLLLAVEAGRLDDSPEARGALLGQLGRAGAVVGFLRGGADNLSAATVSRDGRRLATGGTDGSVSVWRLPEAEPVDTVALLSGPITALAFAADGELAAGGAEGDVARWTPGTSDVVRFGAHTGSVLAIAFRRDGNLVSAGRDGLLRAFSGSTGGGEAWSTSVPAAAAAAAFDRNAPGTCKSPRAVS